MTIYSSGSIRFNGLGSDTDFDDMIGKLYRIESRQVTQLMRWRNDWQLRLDAFKEVRSSLMDMQTALSKLNNMNKFMIKNAVSSDSRVASATADASSIDATHTLSVGNLAKAYTWSQNTGLYQRTDIITNGDGGGIFEYTYKGITRAINVPKGTTAEGLVRLINNDSQNPGARAQLIQTGDGITFQMYGMETGRSNTLVIRKTDGLVLNTSPTPSAYHEDVNSAQLIKGFADPYAIINTSAENKTFNYTVDGQRFTVTVPPGMTLDSPDGSNSLIGEINKRTPGLASLEARPDGPDGALLHYFTLHKPNTTYDFVGDDAFDSFVGAGNPFSYDAVLNEDGSTDIIANFEIRGSDGSKIQKSVAITPNMSLLEFRDALASQVGSHGTVSLQPVGDQWFVDIKENPTIHRVTVEDGTLEEFAYKIPTDEYWSVMHGENAQIKVNGWPGGENPDIWFESASNTIAAGTIVEGVSFRLLQEGDTTITTSTDTEKIKENIESFVNAVNTFRVALNALTVVDEEKKTLDPRYAESQFEMQKGNLLTGNYGIQMIDSRLNMAIAGSALGFLPKQYDSSGIFLGGDIFSSLSQIGITTSADQGSAFFGLLVINEISGDKGSKSLDDALQEDPMAVARLFASSNEGFTDSSDFGYNSQISGVTKAGSYSVRYVVNADGQIENAWINGEEAGIDHANNQITSISGASRGLVIDIYPHSLTPGTEVTGTVSLREGKVNELLSMLDGAEGMLGTSGTLRNMERNYQEIIDNIDKKIVREDERLAKWERTMINKFARLDAVLARYNALNESIQAQLAQLGTLNANRNNKN